MIYQEAFQESIEHPESFWGKAAEEIIWDRKWDRVLDDSKAPFYKWFPGGRMNTCFNAVDRHINQGRENKVAVIYDSPVTRTVQKFTFAELKDRVSRIAGFLKGLGVEKGDTVLIYMPMIPEALMSMLACARIGAIHSVVFGGFAPRELAVRIDDAKPKVILSASCGIEIQRIIPYKPLLDEAIEIAGHKPEKCVLIQRPQAKAELFPGRDLDWGTLEAAAQPADCVSVAATDPLYILYTSGTTGRPKGIVRDNGGHAVALKWTMKHIYNIYPGDVYWAASDVGWVVGHSYIVYGPLLMGATTVIYEGKPVGTPDPGAFWRVISEHRVKALFTAPTAFRAIKREDPHGDFLNPYDISKFEALFLAGERLDPDTYYWASELLKRPVIDHWWQTETGWAIAGNFLGLEYFPIKPGSATKPMPGYNIKILDPRYGPGNRARSKRGHCDQTAPAPGQFTHPLERRPKIFRILYESLSRILSDWRRWLYRPGRVCLCHGPYRRRDQCGWPPLIHRRNGRGPGPASRCGRVCRGGSRRRLKRSGSGRLCRFKKRGFQVNGRNHRRDYQDGSKRHRPCGLF